MEELRREREQAEAEKVMPSEQILVRVSSGQVAIAVSRSRLEEVGFELSVSGCQVLAVDLDLGARPLSKQHAV